MCQDKEVVLTKLDSKVSGAYVQTIKTIGDQVIVGDILKGIMVFDLKEGRQAKFTLAEGPSSGQVNTWVNDILVLSPSKYLVVDNHRNIFVFHRNLEPTNEIQKFQLTTVAQINSGEEITCAIMGSISATE